jgi:hypothetical protein
VDTLKNNNTIMDTTTTSYKKIRQTIGALGIALPVLIYLHTGIIGGCWHLQDSISHYFYTTGNVFFEGVLWILGLVLIYYPAYKDDKKGDVILTRLSGFLAWGVALIPTNNDSKDSCAIFNFPPHSDLRNGIHLACAGIMLLIFSYISIKLFTRKNPENYSVANPEDWKTIRNRIYRTCGIVTAMSIVAILVLMQVEKNMHIIIGFKYTFWFEVTAIVPFGIAWLVKGGFLFTDKGEASTVEQAKNLLFKPKEK